jgi:hypothetical protein
MLMNSSYNRVCMISAASGSSIGATVMRSRSGRLRVLAFYACRRPWQSLP